MLIELARVTVRSFLSILETSWRSGELFDDWKRTYIAPFKTAQNSVQGARKLAAFLFLLGKIRAWVFLERVSGHKKEMIWNKWHGFIKGKSFKTSLIAFYGRMAELLYEGRTVDVIYLDVSEAFNSVSNNILVLTFGHYSLNGWRTRWVNSESGG